MGHTFLSSSFKSFIGRSGLEAFGLEPPAVEGALGTPFFSSLGFSAAGADELLPLGSSTLGFGIGEAAPSFAFFALLLRSDSLSFLFGSAAGDVRETTVRLSLSSLLSFLSDDCPACCACWMLSS